VISVQVDTYEDKNLNVRVECSLQVLMLFPNFLHLLTLCTLTLAQDVSLFEVKKAFNNAHVGFNSALVMLL